MVVGSSQAGPSISESSPGFTENGLKKDKRQFFELKKGFVDAREDWPRCL